jgi:hypothetical protein
MPTTPASINDTHAFDRAIMREWNFRKHPTKRLTN